jgi:hypothetical protein
MPVIPAIGFPVSSLTLPLSLMKRGTDTAVAEITESCPLDWGAAWADTTKKQKSNIENDAMTFRNFNFTPGLRTPE